tara:strand:- start:366 stop:530 length:165 start_codon:yes stop_codon:yes gene_type:complete
MPQFIVRIGVRSKVVVGLMEALKDTINHYEREAVGISAIWEEEGGSNGIGSRLG